MNDDLDIKLEISDEEAGVVNISEDVVSIVAAMAANGIDGVAGMTQSSITGGISELFGKKNPSKGVKVFIEENKVTIDMFIMVKYGAIIPDVAWRIQEKVKQEVESMTGLDVAAVNVHIEGVAFPKEIVEKAEESKE